MTDLERWQEENAGFCEPLNARITPEQCKTNKSSCYSCVDCEGLNMAKRGTCENCKRENISMYAGGKCKACYDWHKNGNKGVPANLREVPKRGHKACVECGEIRKIHSHGECAPCLYKKYGKAMRPPAVAVSSVIDEPGVVEDLATPVAEPEIILSPSGLDRLAPLIQPVDSIKLPAELIANLREKEVTDTDIELLIRLALSGCIRRVA